MVPPVLADEGQELRRRRGRTGFRDTPEFPVADAQGPDLSRVLAVHGNLGPEGEARVGDEHPRCLRSAKFHGGAPDLQLGAVAAGQHPEPVAGFGGIEAAQPGRQPLGQRRGTGQRDLDPLAAAEGGLEGEPDDPGDHRVREVHVADGYRTETRCRQKRQLGGVAVDRASVTDHRVGGRFTPGVPGLQSAPVEAESESGGMGIVGILRELDAPHLGEGVRVQYPREFAPGHQGEEPAQVADRGHHRTGGRHSQREVGGRKLAAVVSPHRGVREPLRRRRGQRKRAGRQPERGKHLFGHRFGEGHSGGVLQNPSHHRDPGVRVLLPDARREHERNAVQALDGRGERRAGVVEVVPHRRLADEPGAVRHQPAQRDPARIRDLRGPKVRKGLRDLGIEVELTGFVPRHHRDVGEELRDRPDPEERVRVGRHAGTRLAEAPRPDDPVAVGEGERQRRDPLVLHLRGDETREAGGEFRIVRSRPDDRGPRNVRRPAAGQQREREPGRPAGPGPVPHGMTPPPDPLAALVSVHAGSSRVSGAGPPSSLPEGRPPSASSKKSAIRFQRMPTGG